MKLIFHVEILLNNRQVASSRNVFANNSSVNIKFLKTELSKIMPSGGFRGKLL